MGASTKRDRQWSVSDMRIAEVVSNRLLGTDTARKRELRSDVDGAARCAR